MPGDAGQQITIQGILAGGIERGESAGQRAVVFPEEADPILRRRVAEHEVTPCYLEVADCTAEQLALVRLRTPERGRREWRPERYMPGDGAEDVADEAVGCPVRQADLAARPADAQQFARRLRVVRREHHTLCREYHVKGGVAERQRLGIALLK